jgi:hypothetical protein
MKLKRSKNWDLTPIHASSIHAGNSERSFPCTLSFWALKELGLKAGPLPQKIDAINLLCQALDVTLAHAHLGKVRRPSVDHFDDMYHL